MVSWLRKVVFSPRFISNIGHTRCRYTPLATQFKRPNSTQGAANGIWENKKVVKWFSAYEDLVGLTEVKAAQTKVLQFEEKCRDIQSLRRKKQMELNDVQSKLKEVHADLDKEQKGTARHLNLVHQEYDVIQDEKRIMEELNEYEELERNHFSALSSATRESFEKERARAERTKYWSVTASAVGVLLGVLSTSVNNLYRMRQLKRLIREQTDESIETKGLVSKLTDGVTAQHNIILSFVKEVGVLSGRQDAVPETEFVNVKSGEEPNTKIDLILEQDKILQEEINEIKTLLAKTKVLDNDGNTIYIGSELEEALGKSEEKLETKIKLTALYTVTLVYAAFALTLPVLYGIFKGS